MIFYSVSRGASGASDWIRMDSGEDKKGVFTLLVDFDGATVTADVEFAVEKDLTSPEAIVHDVLTGITASAASDMQSPASAFRLNLTSYTSGTVTLRVVQQ